MRPAISILSCVFVVLASADPMTTLIETATSRETPSSSNRFPGDFDGDFDVDFADFLAFAAVFGLSSSDDGYNVNMDMDGSGTIDFGDFVALANVFGTTYPSHSLATDREALVALYNATDGPNWRRQANWLTNKDVSTWEGVTVTDDRVTDLHLGGNNLNGALPPALAGLSNLQSLILSENALTGFIPSELGNLSNLGYLELSSNLLSGRIPHELGNLSEMFWLKLSRNLLSGRVPPELGRLVNLFALEIDANYNLSGQLPRSLTRLPEVEIFSFTNTRVCAPRYRAFQEWLLDIPDHSGLRCPSPGGSLATDREALVTLYHATGGPNWKDQANWLTDKDPSTWHGITVFDGRVAQVQLHQNNLRGTLSASLGNLTGIEPLRLWGNELTGSIAPELGNLVNLGSLALHDNKLSGIITPELGKLVNLTILSLSGNALTGPIPPDLGNLIHLDKLSLHTNQLSGTIPAELGRLMYIVRMNLSGNGLEGSIPTDFGKLSDLTTLQVHDNTNLTGALPLSFTMLPYLDEFYFHNTGLCAPADIAFQMWLQGISQWNGGSCE